MATPEQAITLHKKKIKSMGVDLKAIVDQGRLAQRDPAQLPLFKGMFRTLDSLYEKFMQTWDTLFELYLVNEKEADFPSQNESTYLASVKALYYEAHSLYEQFEASAAAAARSNTTVIEAGNTALNCTHTRARLPKINLPRFTGCLSDWALFRDSFTSLVDSDDSLSDIEKYHFLVGALGGSALALIKSIPLTEANYIQAWKLLSTNYNNRRKLGAAYLSQILNFKLPSHKPTPETLKSFLLTVSESVNAFHHLKIPEREQTGFILFELAIRCLDPITREAVELELVDQEFPQFSRLVELVESRCQALSMMSDRSIIASNNNPTKSVATPASPNKFQPKGSRSSTSTSKFSATFFAGTSQPTSSINKRSFSCFICQAKHTLTDCPTYLAAKPPRRLELLQSWPGCRNCLYLGHKTKECSSTFCCRQCGGRHHTTLHLRPISNSSLSKEKMGNASDGNPTDSDVVASTSQSSGKVLTHLSSTPCPVLLGTAYANIEDACGDLRKIRLIIDSGSQYSFITSQCVKALGLSLIASEANITGLGHSPIRELKGKVKCNLHPIGNEIVSLVTEAVVVPMITHQLPQTPIPSNVWQKYLSFDLADPTFFEPGPIDFLMGADLFLDIIVAPPIALSPKLPKVLNTLLGHIVSGRVDCSELVDNGLSFVNTDSVDTLLHRFWQIEEVPCKSAMMSTEELKCENHFQATHYRLPEGRYVVSLPFKNNEVAQLIQSKERALKRLYSLESKLSRSPKLKQEYQQFMSDYLRLGHMTPTTTKALCVLPHHAVYNANSISPKLRIVFDGSAKTSGRSLNDLLLPGPKLQKDIAEILLNFRRYRFVLTADIVKMYRQILIHEPDRAFQHILWRTNPNEQVEEYELTTVTYGLTSAPYLALRVINQLTLDEGAAFPLAADTLQSNIYVDDIASGADNISDLQRLKNELIQLLGKGCFSLSKWASNSPEILTSVETTAEPYHRLMSEDTQSSIKILGMRWDWQADTFSYAVEIPRAVMTKRAILSCIARIYDPLGYLAPTVFLAKIILQDSWKSGVGWDEEVSPALQQRWKQYLDDLPNVRLISIPRYISTVQGETYQLIGFSDASEKGYCAVLYLRIPTTFQTFLLKAKTKLAPTKVISVPRLELCAALLLARLVESIKKLLDHFHICNYFYFTDSSIVLGWLNTPSYLLKTFIANRIEHIREITDVQCWRHVSSEENPADCGSRGALPSNLAHHTLWWHGAPWLSLPESSWPVSHIPITRDLPETKPYPWAAALFTYQPPDLLRWMERFSSLNKLIRVLSYVLRFISNAKVKNDRRLAGAVTYSEYRQARLIAIKVVQHHYYPEAFKDTPTKLTPLLYSLNAFVDQEGVLRVGGRIDHAQLPESQKHQILLPRRSHFTTLVVDFYHHSSLHIGSNALQAIIFQQFWIPGARSLIKQRKMKCKVCYKHSKSLPAPFMGNLPASRLSEWRAFHNTGIDFAGPFLCRETARRKAPTIKAYLCLFICLSVKAIHLEVVPSLSTEAFLDAFERFAARRGTPSLIMTDCGTNFVGASRHLKEVSSWLNRKDTQDHLVTATLPRSITWQFNPPHSPHFGGIWEANIKVVKTLLRKVIGVHSCTYEELGTVFTKIEALINSRPLTQISTDPTDLEALTPAHFLVGGSLLTIPEHDLTDIPENRLSRWQLVRERVQHFWRRWRREYLTTLQQRRKWTTSHPNLAVGDLVCVIDQDTPPAVWPLARIIAVHPGDDDIVRVATIQTATGTYKRPAVKLLPLKPILSPFPD